MSDPYHPRRPLLSLALFFHYPPSLYTLVLPFSPPHVHHSASLRQQESGRAMPPLLMLIARGERGKTPFIPQRRGREVWFACRVQGAL
jgi:hypothetical protein